MLTIKNLQPTLSPNRGERFVTSNVLVFKTSINTKKQVQHIDAVFLKNNIKQYTIDLTDCDKVLRVIAAQHSVEEICLLLVSNGYQCCELT
jgi:hypothetical protein